MNNGRHFDTEGAVMKEEDGGAGEGGREGGVNNVDPAVNTKVDKRSPEKRDNPSIVVAIQIFLAPERDPLCPPFCRVSANK